MKYYSKENYYSYLDQIIMRSRRRKMAQKWFEVLKDICIYLLSAGAVYGAFYFVWSMLCYVFPEW